MKIELVSVTQLGESFFKEPRRGLAMNKLLCEKGFQTKREGKKGYTVTAKGEPFAFKMEPGKYYWNPKILDVLEN